MFSEVFGLKPTSSSGGVFTRRDALPRVPNMEMTRHLKNGDTQKRIPPNKARPRVTKVSPFLTFFACTQRLALSLDPEGRRILAGGVSHRFTNNRESAPAGAALNALGRRVRSPSRPDAR